jgi:hypothetical protein
MRIIQYIDLLAQTAIIAFLVFITASSENAVSGILTGMLLLGPYQMASCFISVIAGANWRKKRILHFVVSVLFLLILGLITYPSSLQNENLRMCVMIIPSLALGAYYYWISLKSAFMPRPDNNRFLRHLSF